MYNLNLVTKEILAALGSLLNKFTLSDLNGLPAVTNR